MIDNVVGSIIEAENQAKRMIEEAEKAASNLLSDTDILIDTANKKASSENKAFVQSRLNEARAEAESAAKSHCESKRGEIEKEVSAYKKNIGAAKKIITESVQ